MSPASARRSPQRLKLPALEGSRDEVIAEIHADRLRLFTIAPSLGGVKSLLTEPITSTHHGLTAAERARRGIADSMIRLSCGLEDAEDLWADLEQVLAC